MNNKEFNEFINDTLDKLLDLIMNNDKIQKIISKDSNKIKKYKKVLYSEEKDNLKIYFNNIIKTLIQYIQETEYYNNLSDIEKENLDISDMIERSIALDFAIEGQEYQDYKKFINKKK